MQEKLSQRIMIGELIVIVLPIFLILTFLTLFLLVSIGDFLMALGLVLFYLLVPWVTLIPGIILMITFIRRGASGLQNANPHLWRFCVFGGMLVVTGSILILIHLLFPDQAKLFQTQKQSTFGIWEYLITFIVAMPLLAPFIHLLLERYLRREVITP